MFYIIFLLIILYISGKLLIHIRTSYYKSKTKLNGKVAIVVDSNNGINLETVRDLVKRGAKVIMACKNVLEANVKKEEIIRKTGNRNIIVKKLNVSSMKSVRHFVNYIIKTENRLDLLVHNTGKTFENLHQTVDGIEITMATNHYGPFLLTILLVDLMKKTHSSRIIFVSSILYFAIIFDFKGLEKLDFLINRSDNEKYVISKSANALLTKELGRRLKGTNVTVNCFHPGSIFTPIFNLTQINKLYLNKIIKYFDKTTTDKAQTQIYLCASEEIKNVSGMFFINSKGFNFANSLGMIEASKHVWEISEEIVQLNLYEKNILKSVKAEFPL